MDRAESESLRFNNCLPLFCVLLASGPCFVVQYLEVFIVLDSSRWGSEMVALL